MPGWLLTVSSTVTCAHGGTATPQGSSPRVRVAGVAAVTAGTPYLVTGCSLTVEQGGPCVSAEWVGGSLRISAGGPPVLLSDGRAIAVPTGAPLRVVTTQTRVKGA
jgi:hypothetical protein